MVLVQVVTFQNIKKTFVVSTLSNSHAENLVRTYMKNGLHLNDDRYRINILPQFIKEDRVMSELPPISDYLRD